MMRAVALAVLFAFAGCSSAPEFTSELAPRSVTVLPIRIVRDAPVVVAEIGGRPVSLLVDIGAFDTISLRASLFERLGVRTTGRTHATYDAFGNRLDAREYRVAEVKLGALVLRDVVGYEFMHVPSNQPPAEIDGCVGLGVLSQFFVVLDVPARELRLSREARWPEKGEWHVVPFEHTDEGIVTLSLVDGVERRCIWDSGASISIMNAGLVGPEGVEKRGRLSFFRVTELTINGRAYGPLEFVLLDIPEPGGDLLLGHNWFQRHPVAIDFVRKEMRIR